jgi:integrase
VTSELHSPLPSRGGKRVAGAKVRLNDSNVRKLAAPEVGQTLYRDTELPGLAVRVLATGKRAFVVDKWHGDKQVRVTLGSTLHLSTERARQLARQALGKLAEGINPIEQKRAAQAHSISLDEILEAYLSSRKNLATRTIYDYRRLIECYLFDWKSRPLLALDKDTIERLHADIGERSPAQANYVARLLRALFNFAKEKYPDARIDENPVQRLSSVKAWYRIQRRQTFIKTHDLKAWWKATDAINDDSRDYLRVLLLTGLRKLEGAKLEGNQVDLKAKTFTAIRKGNIAHTLPMGKHLLALFSARMKKTEGQRYLFPSWGAKGHITEAQKSVAKVAEISDVPFTLHDLRRTFATIAESLDISSYAVKRLLNHAVDNNDVTSGYLAVDAERLRKPMQQIEDFVLRHCGIKLADQTKSAKMKSPRLS